MTEVDLDALTPGARRVLDAASALFYARGIHAVGVEAIAEASGVTKRTLYDRFGSKEALVQAYLRDRQRRWWVRAEEEIERSGVLGLFDAYADPGFVRGRGCAMINAAGEHVQGDPVRELVHHDKERLLRRIGELLGSEALAARPGLDWHLFLLLEGSLAAEAAGLPDEGRARGAAEALLAAAGLRPGG